MASVDKKFDTAPAKAPEKDVPKVDPDVAVRDAFASSALSALLVKSSKDLGAQPAEISRLCTLSFMIADSMMKAR